MSLAQTPTLGLRKNPLLSDAEFKDLSGFVYEKTGIDIPAARKYLLENRLGPRLAELGLGSFTEYTSFLRKSPAREKEMEKFFEKITTNETSFYRDTKQLETFQKDVLKEVLERQEKAGKKELFIWSAGCSSGEEPYTLGILLHETLRMAIIGWKIQITANDISAAMLEKARRGVYTEHSLRTTPKDILARYFTPEPGGYRIHPKVQKLVSFQSLNLNDPLAVKRVARSHIVFCRNVIIYFDEAMKKKVLTSFYENLLPEGYLVLGHSESLHRLSTGFQPNVKPGTMIYRKMT